VFLSGCTIRHGTRSEGLGISMNRRHQTQWAAQFAVASELCKRGYEVAFTMGNHPEADLMVLSQGKKAFVVDVKGPYKKNPFVIKPKDVRSDLYYILAFVPDGAQNDFYILSQEQVRKTTAAELKRLGRDQDYSMPGLSWPCLKPFKDKWTTLPS
jgi:hypothetical protein